MTPSTVEKLALYAFFFLKGGPGVEPGLLAQQIKYTVDKVKQKIPSHREMGGVQVRNLSGLLTYFIFRISFQS